MSQVSFKTVGFVELATHNEVLRSYLLIMLEICHEIKVFTLKQNYDQLYDLHSHPQIKWFLLVSPVECQKFLNNQEEELHSCGLIIVTTVSNDLTFFAKYKFTSTSWLVIHNYKRNFKPVLSWQSSNSSWLSLKNLVKILKYYFLQERKMNFSLLQNYDNIILPSSFIKDNPLNDSHLCLFKNPIVFDFTVNEKLIFNLKSSPVKIIIPGTISNNSKDFKVVLEAFKLIIPRIKIKVQLIFLGQLKEKEAALYIMKLKEFENELFKIKYFTSFVHQLEFDTIIQDAHFLILPLKMKMKSGIFLEEYGKTTVSGSIGDMVKYGIPAILPDFYPLDKDIEPLIKRYSNEKSLVNQIIFMLNSDLDNLRKEAEFGLKKYSPQNVAKRLIEQIKLL